eukprot:9956843-Prorocentrum_lima.AAC.1
MITDRTSSHRWRTPTTSRSTPFGIARRATAKTPHRMPRTRRSPGAIARTTLHKPMLPPETALACAKVVERQRNRP